jgi:uncharacterized protein
MSDTGTGNDILQEMVDVIVPMVAPESIILFGSRARGTAGPQSDVDLMVVVKEGFGPLRSRRLELTRLWRALGSFLVPKDILLFSRDEVERWRGSLNHVVARALREGKVIYERP